MATRAGWAPRPLTPREREVAALVADGLTNREIAARLAIAERTAEGHVEQIRNKLAFNSRSQIAAWAAEQRQSASARTPWTAPTPPATQTQRKAQRRPRHPLPELSRRETEVARLVAEGLTNRQIADRLFISERTAEYHVEQLRTKLGVHSRQEIAASLHGTPPPNHLPPQLSSFVGRSSELDGVRALLNEARLVTVTGPGGSGKTRLALEAAARVIDHYPDGAWLVDLQSLEDPALLRPEVAAALGVDDPKRDLASARLLVVLDNCEQVAAACRDLVAELLAACPDIKVLATSREPLRVPGEAVWSLRPLPAEDAVSLFLDRARLAAPDLPLAATDPTLVLAICQDLDGIPLAIELAASRVRVMSLADIRDRLRSRFRILVDGASLVPRQRSLAAAVAWSYELLSEAERGAFRALGAFVGGFRVDSAEAVLGPKGAELLDRLVERSLVLAERVPDKPIRYRLLLTMREYARERLLEAGEAGCVQAAHTKRFFELARLASDGLDGPEQATWMARIEDELDEYRAVFDRVLEVEPDVALAIAAGLGWFWGLRGRVGEGRRLLAAALARSPRHTVERAQALVYSGWLARLQGDHEAGRRYHAASIDILRGFDDPIELGKALVWNAEAASARGDLETAHRGWLEAVELLAPLGTSQPLAYAHLELATVELQFGRSAGVRRYALGGLAMMQELGNLRAVALFHTFLATAALLDERFEEAWAELRRAADGLGQVGARADLIGVLETSAILRAAEGDPEMSVLLSAGAEALRRQTGMAQMPSDPYDQPDAEAGPSRRLPSHHPRRMRRLLRRAEADARDQLGEAAFEAAWQRGLVLGPEAVIDLLWVTRS